MKTKSLSTGPWETKPGKTGQLAAYSLSKPSGHHSILSRFHLQIHPFPPASVQVSVGFIPQIHEHCGQRPFHTLLFSISWIAFPVAASPS